MDLASVLTAAQDEVVTEATRGLDRAHLKHYEVSGTEQSRRRLEDLYALVVECLEQRTLGPIRAFATRVAEERFREGFDIAEVQTAFNLLEEAIWRIVICGLSADQLVEAAGLIGTVIGAGKDTLARTWVSAATSHHVRSLDLSALFEGVSS